MIFFDEWLKASGKTEPFTAADMREAWFAACDAQTAYDAETSGGRPACVNHWEPVQTGSGIRPAEARESEPGFTFRHVARYGARDV